MNKRKLWINAKITVLWNYFVLNTTSVVLKGIFLLFLVKTVAKIITAMQYFGRAFI